MPAKRHLLPKFVQAVRAKGRLYYYFRAKAYRVKLEGEPGSSAFHVSYAAALARMEKDPPRQTHRIGTVGWLIASYKASPDYKVLSDRTRISYARELDRLSIIADFEAAAVKRRHINAIRDQLADRPRARQLFGQVCSLLWGYGIRELDLECANPAALMRRAGDAVAFVPWSAEQMAAFELSQPPRHLMTAYMIARYVGPRRGDLVSLRISAYDGARLAVPGQKTDAPVVVPVHPTLKAYLDIQPKTLTLVADQLGRPVSDNRLSKDLRAHLDGIGLAGLHLHGLRHTAGKALAEAGCTPHEIAAVLGHSTLQMVEKYTKKAEQERLAGAAIAKLAGTGTKRDGEKP